MIKVKEYRGHIRNWEALCAELHIDKTLSREAREEAILIKAYEAWGCKMADHMHGMFAFALFDEEADRLFCLRDQFGTKPFYYYVTEDGRLLYGTMIRQIMEQDGFVKELNDKLLQIYMSLTYIPGEETFFKGVKKLLPGRYLIWEKGEMTIERYWKPEFHPDDRTRAGSVPPCHHPSEVPAPASFHPDSAECNAGISVPAPAVLGKIYSHPAVPFAPHPKIPELD